MDTCNASPLDSTPPVRGRMNIVIVGHVDHGKSTLLGRLYADTGSLPEGKLEKIQAICRQQGKEFEYAFLFDAFLEEQQQGITIDTARTFFQWDGRQYIIIDAPGHKEFLKNMVSGAARAEAALLVIDALEGVREQSRRHGLLLSMLGVRQVTVVVNKMDLVGYRHDTFESIKKEYQEFLAGLNVTPQYVIPASAKLGDNIVQRSRAMAWYTGPTVLESLGLFSSEVARHEKPLRFPLQDVYKFDARRILAGRVTAGRITVGDRLIFSPSNKTAMVRSIEAFNVEPPPIQAEAGQSIGITLDEQIFVERGEIVSHEDSLPLVSTTFRANLFWLGRRPLDIHRPYVVRLATQEEECEIVAIHRLVDATNLSAASPEHEPIHQVQRNEVAEVTIRAKTPLAFDLYADFDSTGRFVLVDNYDVAGGGIITAMIPDRHEQLRTEARLRDFAWVKGDVSPEDRAMHYGHRAAVVLLTGPDTAGKAFLARKLESVLVAEGRHAYLLDAANLRRGLDADLHEGNEAAEVVRRYGEVARLLVDTGLLVISTTNPFSLPTEQIVPALQTLIHPVPLLAVYMSREATDSVPEADLVFTGPEDFDALTHHILDALKRKGILAQVVGAYPTFQYSI
ncbi:MAG: adenylyl-sulfate kinase [Nitrospirae bacterium]|nr:MAG: adenylyl-sulfate kinase [Nitrospirota bacterium]